MLENKDLNINNGFHKQICISSGRSGNEEHSVHYEEFNILILINSLRPGPGSPLFKSFDRISFV